jgi:hypothetical protein
MAEDAIDAAIRRAHRPRPDILEALRESARESEAYVLEQHARQQHVRTLDAVRDFLIANPGVVHPDQNGDLVYTEKYLRFAAGLAALGQPGEDMSSEMFASAVGVPLATLAPWLKSTDDRRANPQD